MAPGILINIDVDDLQRGTTFYTALLDLEIGRRLGPAIVELVGGAAPIYLLLKPADSNASPVSGDRRRFDRHWTPVHLDFVVTDLDAAVAKALAGGATQDDAPAVHAWGRIAHMADPFGNGFCLIQFVGRGYDAITER